MTTPEGHNDLLPAIELALQQSDEPLDCNELFDMPEIREIAPSVNRVSDYLGVLFRRGVVSRIQSPKDGTSRARWKYFWKGRPLPAWRTKGTKVVDYRPKPILDRPNMYIADEGDFISIELPNLIIEIKKK